MQPFRLFRGKSGSFFIEDVATKKQVSLRTRDKVEAQRLLAAKNEARREPNLCLQIARAYLTAADPVMSKRTWRTVMNEVTGSKRGPTQRRWVIACKDHAFDYIRDVKLTETRAEQFWKVLNAGTVSTNTFLRRLHNFAVDMNWILTPVTIDNARDRHGNYIGPVPTKDGTTSPDVPVTVTYYPGTAPKPVWNKPKKE